MEIHIEKNELQQNSDAVPAGTSMQQDNFVQKYEASTWLTHTDEGDVCVGAKTLFSNDFPATGNGVVIEKNCGNII
jgi:hypothetical protein